MAVARTLRHFGELGFEAATVNSGNDVIRWQPQRGQDGRVRGRHLGSIHVANSHPAQRMAFACTRLSLPRGHPQRMQPHGFSGVVPGNRNQRGAAADFDAEFFIEFADQRLRDGFAGLDFPAREFPQPRQVLARQPLHQQHTALRVHEDAGGDFDSFSLALRERVAEGRVRVRNSAQGSYPHPGATRW